MELHFKRDTATRKQYFTPGSFAHPAKMDCQLLMWIVEQYTTVGETILDPMFGSGTTVIACTVGRNVIGIELEEKFVDMSKANWEKVRQMPQLGHTMGNCQILQGNARQLKGLLFDNPNNLRNLSYSNIDHIITSPPYSNDNANLGNRSDKSATSVLATTGMRGEQLGEGNIGNLKGDSYFFAML